MNSRLTQSNIQAYYARLQPVITALADARRRYPTCPSSALRQFRGLATFVKQLRQLPHDSDYSKFEVQLKRRLVRILHRLNGHKATPEAQSTGLLDAFPAHVYAGVFERHQEAARAMLRRLSQVDIQTDHQHLQKLQDIA